ncbi:MAG: TIGR03936 family radical SAM-associated protein [Acetatifactor sp.]|nr:TIGR03936 family radical SAM-associated protein [Acetatifactor sp.]
MKLRIKFTKFGPIRFIGHLDVMRFFQKAIRRSEIDVKYTSGFSPHQVMSFAQPLSVGVESNGEYMDIEVNSITNCKDIMDRINAVSVEGIKVTDVTILPDNAKNAMSSVAAALYTVIFKDGYMPSFDLSDGLSKMLEKDELLIEKTGKAGKREVDIKPGLFDIKVTDKGYSMLLDCSSSGNVKPSQVISKLYEVNDEKEPENIFFHVTREETYKNNGTEEEPLYQPMNVF